MRLKQYIESLSGVGVGVSGGLPIPCKLNMTRHLFRVRRARPEARVNGRFLELFAVDVEELQVSAASTQLSCPGGDDWLSRAA
jgi:hypothetical protein